MNQLGPVFLLLLTITPIFHAGCAPSSEQTSAEDLLRAKRRLETERLSKAKTYTERIEASRKYVQDGNPIAAEDELRPLLISSPEDPETLLLWSKTQAIAGEKKAAIETIEKLEGAGNDFRSQALTLGGQWLIDLNQFDRAKQKLEAILQMPGQHVETLQKLATILNNQGRRIEAGQYLKQLAKTGKISEKELIAMVTLGNPFLDQSMPKPDFGKQLSPAMLVMAREARSRGELSEAESICKKLSAEFPSSTQIHAFLGRVVGDQQSKEKLRQWAAKLPPGIEREPEYWNALAVLMQLENRQDEAVRCLIETVDRDETNRAAYLSLARLMNQLDQPAIAQACIARSELIAETARIAKELGFQRGSLDQLNRMTTLMKDLRRPWESLGWKTISLKQGNASEEEWAKLEQQRAELISAEGQRIDQSPKRSKFRLCGLNRSDWKLPAIESLPPTAQNEKTQASIDPDSSTTLKLIDIANQVDLIFHYDNGDDPSDADLYIHQVTGGGIGVIDFDLDGWPDLYLAQGGGDAFSEEGSKPNQLLRNNRGQRWNNVTDHSETGNQGYSQGIAIADLNQDGWPDAVVANLGRNIVYINNGDGSFHQVMYPKHENPEGGWTTSIGCGDLSGDHLPEIFEVNYIDDPTALTISCGSGTIACNPAEFKPAQNRVLSINADGSIDAWNGCNEIQDKANYGFGLIIANFDDKAGNDVFIANDTKNNHLWLSRGTENPDSGYQLTETAQLLGCATAQNGLARGCMGIAHGDFDRNQRLDLHVTNFWNQAANVYLLQDTDTFAPGNYRLGLFDQSVKTVGWGTQAADLDLDGWLDIAVLNGHVTDLTSSGQPFEMSPQLFQGGPQGFSQVRSETRTRNYWSRPTLGRTMATLDWNQDGKVDMVSNHLDAPLALLENQTETNQGRDLRFQLIGSVSERDAIGASVTIQDGNETWKSWISGGDGFLCSNESIIHFGVGDRQHVDSVTVRWPSGLEQNFQNLTTSRSYLIVEGSPELHTR